MKLFCVLVASLLVAVSASAQTMVTATSGFTIAASSDHLATNADGTPVISRYEARFQPSAGCVSMPAIDLAKPAPVNNLITVKPFSGFAALPPNCSYTMTVVAVGPGGEGASAATSPFWRLVPKVPAAPAGAPTVLP